MKLSDAIREGAKLRPQGFGSMYSDGKSCALGAAYEAAFGKLPMENDMPLRRRFPILASHRTSCPECEYKYIRDLGTIITHLNDPPHLWTREAIADWLDSLSLEAESE